MKEIQGTGNRYLDVNLTDRTWRVHEVSRDDLKNYLGGKGLGLKIYYDRLGNRLREVDPFGGDNLLIFSNGVLLSTGAPCSARFEVLTKSPLTGLMVCSSCGGPFGEASKTAGWDGLIISGKADAPVTLRIDPDGARFEDAGTLWGKGTKETQKRLGMGPKEGAAVIGPAGENLVLYANVCSGHRFAGRGGIGAVMGAKNLKAIVARGKEYRCVPVQQNRFNRTLARAKKHILRNELTKGYRNYGTNANVDYGIVKGYVPVRNFRDRYSPNTVALTGEAMAERYHTRHSTCNYCSVLCGHKGRYPDGAMRQIPEYETIGLFGCNIENYDPDKIGLWNDIMNDMGMDTISAGGTIAWAMEAGEKGIRKTSLSFGDHSNISRTLEDIALRREEGAELAEGCMRLSEKYGGKDFAIHAKGLEIAAYDPRASWGHGLSYAVHNKGGCHLGSYLVSLECMLEYMPAHSTMGKAQWVAFCEDVFTGVNSLQTCLFTAFSILTEPPVPKYLPRFMLKIATSVMPRTSQMLMDWSVYSSFFWSITGIRCTKGGFRKAGKRINMLERHMNVRMGMEPGQDTLPARFTREAVTKYPGESVVPIEKMVKRYYKVRGYDPATGGPSKKKLEAMGIQY